MALDVTDFYFVGPDRPPQSIDMVDQFVAVAKIILSTNLPNYKMARIPVSSSLNIQAWENYLSDYPDKRVIQYLKFGFPLSLTEGHDLHNTDVSNHASAVQHPEAVTEYLEKEIALSQASVTQWCSEIRVRILVLSCHILCASKFPSQYN